MNCHNCGQPIYEDDLFCPYCGMNNPEAEALAASRAAGASMQASETDAHYYPPDQDDYFEDEYEEIVPEKNPIVPIMLAVAAAVVLIAAILILLLKSGGSDDNKLLFTQPEDSIADNGIINWQTLPTLDLERPEETLATIPDNFVWTMPPVQTSETEREQPTITPATTAEPEIVIMTPTPKPTAAPTSKPTAAPTSKPTESPTTVPEPAGTEPTASESGTPESEDASDTTEPAGSEDTETKSSENETDPTNNIDKKLQLVINDVVVSNFPTVRLYFNLVDENGVESRLAPMASFALTETADEKTNDVNNPSVDDGHIEVLSLIESSAHTLTDASIQSVKDAHEALVKKVLPEGNLNNRMGLFVLPHNFVPANLPDELDFYSTPETLLTIIANLKPAVKGETECNIYSAIREAVTKLNNAKYTGALVIYTYGNDSGSITKQDELDALKVLVSNSNIPIHIVSLTDGPEDFYLKSLADSSRGTFTFLEDLGSLGIVLDGKYTHEAGNYYIEYNSPFAALIAQRKVVLKYTDPDGDISLTADAVYTPPSPSPAP